MPMKIRVGTGRSAKTVVNFIFFFEKPDKMPKFVNLFFRNLLKIFVTKKAISVILGFGLRRSTLQLFIIHVPLFLWWELGILPKMHFGTF